MGFKPFQLRKVSDPLFAKLFRLILYDRHLSYGEKVLALALNDLPGASKPNCSLLARKIHSSGEQVSVWKKNLLKRGLWPDNA